MIVALAITVAGVSCTAAAADSVDDEADGPPASTVTASDPIVLATTPPGPGVDPVGDIRTIGGVTVRPDRPGASLRGSASEADRPLRAAKDRAASLAGTADESTIVAHATSPHVVARQAPSPDADPVADFANPTDRGGPLVFQAIGSPDNGWIEVLLPVRPNGTTGWIPLDEVELSRNPYRIEVDLDAYTISVTRRGSVEISAPIAIGQDGTPTPIGDFFLIELLQPPQSNGPYGSYAYGLSGYSDVLHRFNGGDGVIGIHGTNEPHLLGGPASHGCIRVHNDTIEAMAAILPLGTPVSIVTAADTAPTRS